MCTDTLPYNDNIMTGRVRMIPVLGYWVLGDIRRYWIVLLLGDIFNVVTPNMIPIRACLDHLAKRSMIVTSSTADRDQ